MRFHELTAVNHIGIANAPVKKVQLLRAADTDTSGKPTPYPAHVSLIVRLMRAVYRELDLRIIHGDPDACIEIDAAWVSFPEPYDKAGGISVHCRNWIVEVVRDAAMELGLGFFIGFNEPVYVGRDGKAYYSSALV